MPLDALSLALAAAVVHAAWNLILSGKEDTQAATAVALTAGAIAWAPAAIVLWRVDAAAWPYIAASSALELLYIALLAAAYAGAAMGFVYPIARGSAPVIVLIAGAIAGSASPSAVSAFGVVVVALGIALVRGVGAAHTTRDLVLALVIGACIASYTLVDKHGITRANPLAYLQVVFTITALGYLAGALRVRGPRAVRAAITPSVVVAGVGFFGSYALTLAALRLASAASVAAVRECGVVVAAFALLLTGREPLSRSRLAGAIVVAGGIALVSLG